MKKEDVKLIPSNSGLKVSFSKEFIEKFAETTSRKIAEELYYDLLLLKHIPELEAIKQGKIKALEGEEAKKFLKKLCE
jgi:hypothetical protein